mmetsp:Transcript_29322/g.70758  ORF Transcript_29322/g.70758 Transcript_29322/m.70758 type:complete len:311 (-) Transcript_29322:978-1910(-)
MGAIAVLLGGLGGFDGIGEVLLQRFQLVGRHFQRLPLVVELLTKGFRAPVLLVQLYLELFHPGPLLGLGPFELGPEPFRVLVLLLELDAGGVELPSARAQFALQALDLRFLLGELGHPFGHLGGVGRVGGGFRIRGRGGSSGRVGFFVAIVLHLLIVRPGIRRCCRLSGGGLYLGPMLHELPPHFLQLLFQDLHVLVPFVELHVRVARLPALGREILLELRHAHLLFPHGILQLLSELGRQLFLLLQHGLRQLHLLAMDLHILIEGVDPTLALGDALRISHLGAIDGVQRRLLLLPEQVAPPLQLLELGG